MNDSTPLYSLSVGEFTTLIQDSIKAINNPPQRPEDKIETDIVDIDWVSKNFGMPKGTIYSKVSKNEMPCKKRGKPLQFSKEETLNWVNDGKPKLSLEIDFAPNHKKNNL